MKSSRTISKTAFRVERPGILMSGNSFTLIECVPSHNANTRRMKGAATVNAPFGTGSLTAGFRQRGDRSAVTKPREGKPVLGLPGSNGGLGVSQGGEATMQAAGKRTTASIVKSALAGIADRASETRVASPCSMGEACTRGEDNGKRTRGTRRCKRRRHAQRVNASNWGGPPRSPSRDGVRHGIRTTSESRGDAVAGGAGRTRRGSRPRLR